MGDRPGCCSPPRIYSFGGPRRTSPFPVGELAASRPGEPLSEGDRASGDRAGTISGDGFGGSAPAVPSGSCCLFRRASIPAPPRRFARSRSGAVAATEPPDRSPPAGTTSRPARRAGRERGQARARDARPPARRAAGAKSGRPRRAAGAASRAPTSAANLIFVLLATNARRHRRLRRWQQHADPTARARRPSVRAHLLPLPWTHPPRLCSRRWPTRARLVESNPIPSRSFRSPIPNGLVRQAAFRNPLPPTSCFGRASGASGLAARRLRVTPAAAVADRGWVATPAGALLHDLHSWTPRPYAAPARGRPRPALPGTPDPSFPRQVPLPTPPAGFLAQLYREEGPPWISSWGGCCSARTRGAQRTLVTSPDHGEEFLNTVTSSTA